MRAAAGKDSAAVGTVAVPEAGTGLVLAVAGTVVVGARQRAEPQSWVPSGRYYRRQQQQQ